MALYDVRASTPLRKLVMLKRANKARTHAYARACSHAAPRLASPHRSAPSQLAWNPREAFNFTVASEDNNLYSFDMRKLDIASNVHKDFVSVRCAALRGWEAHVRAAAG